MYMYLSKLQEIVEDRGSWYATVHGVAKSWHNLEPEEEQQHLCIYLSINHQVVLRGKNLLALNSMIMGYDVIYYNNLQSNRILNKTLY